MNQLLEVKIIKDYIDDIRYYYKGNVINMKGLSYYVGEVHLLKPRFARELINSGIAIEVD